jgi:hypothetical protein
VDVEQNKNPYCANIATATDLLYSFAEEDHSPYCMAYLLSWRDFTDSGVAIAGKTEG